MLDLIIRGGLVVSPWGEGIWDVAIQGEKIVAVAEGGTLPDEGPRILDASGKIVIPGGIEPHAHAGFRLPYPGSRKGEVVGPPEEVSKAALFGGTTTVVDFANWRTGIELYQAIEERDDLFNGHSYADYTFHCVLSGMGSEGATTEQAVSVPFEIVNQIEEVVRGGFTSVKVWITNTTPTRPKQKTDFGQVWAIMEQLVPAGGVLAVHAEDDDIVMHMYRKLHEEGRVGTEFMHEAHNNLSEDISFRRIIRLAEWTGAATYIMHVSAQEGVQAIGEGRGRGQPIYGETLHHYATFNSERYKEEEGPLYHTYPGLKYQKDADALWMGVVDGTLSTVATDVILCSRDIKMHGRTIEDTVGGNAAIEERVGITYTEGVVKRGMSLQRFVDVTSANAAKILGMYPQKGALSPGSDADITLIDPGLRRRLAVSDLHGSDYSVWDGWDTQGWPMTTILRGKVVVENGRLLGNANDGRLIGNRKTAPEILRGPGC